MDLINKFDFQQHQSQQVPQNIQAIRVLNGDQVIIEPISKTLQIETRLVIDKQTKQVKEDKIQPFENGQLFSAFLGIITVKGLKFAVFVDTCLHCSLHPIYADFFHICHTVLLPLDPVNYRDEELTQAIGNIKELLSKGFYFTYERTSIDQEYQWNSYLCKDVPQQWTLFVIQGFIDQFQVYQDGKRVQVALIARRSTRSPGTRQAQTGISKDGSVANFVETEQIVSVANIRCSFKIVRGSVPIFWKESGYLIKQLEIFATEKENNEALELHFKQLIKKYERVVCINLMNTSKKSEHNLTQQYEQGIQAMNSDKVKYIYYNFDEYTNGIDFQIVNKQIQQLSVFIKNLQFDADDLVTNQVYMKQRGIIRVNCLSCLDRTNVYQQRIGLLQLDYQLQSMGIKILGNQNILDFNDSDAKNVAPLITLFKSLWADHGDQISLLYSGTGSVHTNQARGRMNQFFQILGCGIVPLQRFYQNNFTEHYRQLSITHILGLGKQQVRPDEDDQFFNLAFTKLDISDIKYPNLVFRTYKSSRDRWIIHAQSDEKLIAIFCHNSDSYLSRVQNINVKRIDHKFAYIHELGKFNLQSLTISKYESQPFTENQLITILYQMAVISQSYLDQGLVLSGLNTKSVWFADKLCFDTVTHPPNKFHEYPTVIKPNFMDPQLLQKLEQQERNLELQEDISNPTDLLLQGLTPVEIQEAQVWILGRIIYVTLFYPQPLDTNNKEIMKSYLQKMIELRDNIKLCQLLQRIFRYDQNNQITSLTQLIQEIEKMKINDVMKIENQERVEQFTQDELQRQVQLCKHFKQHVQGLKVLDQLNHDMSFEEEFQYKFDQLFFYFLKGDLNEFYLLYEDLILYYDLQNERDSLAIKNIIIDLNVLLIQSYKSNQQIELHKFKEILQNQQQNFKHPLSSNVYVALSQLSSDEDLQLEYSQKAWDNYKSNLIQNENLKIYVMGAYLRCLQRSNPNEGIYFASNQLKLVLQDNFEKLFLVQSLVSLYQNTSDTLKAQNLSQQAYNLAVKLYKDEKHRRVLSIRKKMEDLKL